MSYEVVVSASCPGAGVFSRTIVLPFPPTDGLRIEGLEAEQETSVLYEVRWNLNGYFVCKIDDIPLCLLHNGLYPYWKDSSNAYVDTLKAAGKYDEIFVKKGFPPCKNTKS